MSESATDGGGYANAGGVQPGEPQHAKSERAGLREPGAPHSRLGHFMRTMGHLRSIYGPAAHRDLSEEAPPSHNPEDIKESRELEGIDVQTDSEGHHYGVRRPPEEGQPEA